MIGDKDLALPGKMLDLLSTRHKLTAHNLANAEVQGYRPLEAKFSDELRAAIESGDPEAIRNASIEIERTRTPGVDSETEVARMSKNELLFNTFAEIAAFQLRMLRTAVTSK
jgi:flagellar basal body rod protein FlgB